MKRKALHIFLLFCTVFAYGQVTLAISEVKDAKVNQRFNLTVLLEIAGKYAARNSFEDAGFIKI